MSGPSIEGVIFAQQYTLAPATPQVIDLAPLMPATKAKQMLIVETGGVNPANRVTIDGNLLPIGVGKWVRLPGRARELILESTLGTTCNVIISDSDLPIGYGAA